MSNFKPGANVGEYTIEKELGGGTFGIVYKVLHSINSQSVALKVCKDVSDADNLQRFEQENDILHKLKVHQKIICPLSNVLQINQEKYYLMELADCNLEDYLNQNFSTLTLEQKIDLFKRVCEGLDYSHKKGVVHRDLWWNNILLKKEGGIDEAKLTDFGRAKNFESINITSIPLSAWGHVLVCPPEIHFKIWDQPQLENYIFSDIFALGILLHYILESIPATHALLLNYSIKQYFGRKNIDINSLNIPDKIKLYEDWVQSTNFANFNNSLTVNNVDQNLNLKINPIILKLCNPNYKNRYQNVQEVIACIKNI